METSEIKDVYVMKMHLINIILINSYSINQYLQSGLTVQQHRHASLSALLFRTYLWNVCSLVGHVTSKESKTMRLSLLDGEEKKRERDRMKDRKKDKKKESAYTSVPCTSLLITQHTSISGLKLNRIYVSRNIMIYIHYIAKSIGSPPSNARFDYFSNFHEYTS